MEALQEQECKLGKIRAIEILEGIDALTLLANEEFLAQWDELRHNCPWATVFQSKEFVATWYRLYHTTYLPIIIKATLDDKLSGLLTLARFDKNEIQGAGGKHAEYQTWLSKEEHAEAFIKIALSGLKKKYPGSDVKLKFLPESTPLAWVTTDPTWKKRCVLRAFDQPLLMVDETSINNELRKKNRREKINRLKRQGELRIERIEDTALFLSVLNELAIQYDFRNGARYNKIPSKTDPIRKDLIIELYKLNLLHATVLKLNEEIIASSIIAIGNKWLHLWGITTYAPTYAKYSPSILHYLKLCKLLVQEGFEALDLTPGDDPYKIELATKFAVAYELRVAGSFESYIKSNIISIIWNRLSTDKIRRKTFKDKIVKVLYLAKERGLTSLFTEKKISTKHFAESKEDIGYFRKYSTTAIPKLSINKDSLSDLLCYKAVRGTETRWEFLESAWKRFEAGQHCFTLVEDEQLIGCAWFKSIRLNSEPLGSTHSSAHSVDELVLQAIYSHPPKKEKLRHFILSIGSSLVLTNDRTCHYLLADIRDTDLSLTLKEAGFELTQDS